MARRCARHAGAAPTARSRPQALGLGYWRITRLIVLPQALRIDAAMTNEFIALFKNTPWC